MAELTSPYIFTVKRGVTKDVTYSFEYQDDDGIWQTVNFTGKTILFQLDKAKTVDGEKQPFTLSSAAAPTALGSKIEIISDGDEFRFLLTAAEAASFDKTIGTTRHAFLYSDNTGTHEMFDSKAMIIDVTD